MGPVLLASSARELSSRHPIVEVPRVPPSPTFEVPVKGISLVTNRWEMADKLRQLVKKCESKQRELSDVEKKYAITLPGTVGVELKCPLGIRILGSKKPPGHSTKPSGGFRSERLSLEQR